MSGNFRLEPWWEDENFAVRKGVIGPDIRAVIGKGIIYHPIDAQLRHRLPSRIVTSAPVGNLAFLYNPESHAEIVNAGTRAADFFQVTLKFPEHLTEELSENGMADLFRDDWPADFKASVRVDLEGIQRLVDTGFSPAPSPDGILLATMAREDLELKLNWMSHWPGRQRNSPLAFGAPAPPPTKIEVTVTTKDSANNEVDGCTVWANLRGYLGNKAHAIAFSDPSSPTTDKLSVAIYNMWAEKDGATGPTKAVRIAGGASPTTQDCRFGCAITPRSDV